MTTETKPGTVQDAARMMVEAFTIDARDNGEKYYHLQDGSPEWMTEVCHKAHGDMFPDDWRYEFISDAVDMLAESDIDDCQAEADIYTAQLTAWLASRTDRFAYCDDFASELGGDDGDTLSRISGGQWMERDEVLHIVAQALESIIDEDA